MRTCIVLVSIWLIFEQVVGHKPGGVLEKFSADKTSYVHDDRKPQYGFKEFWKDLFAGSKT